MVCTICSCYNSDANKKINIELVATTKISAKHHEMTVFSLAQHERELQLHVESIKCFNVMFNVVVVVIISGHVHCAAVCIE